MEMSLLSRAKEVQTCREARKQCMMRGRWQLARWPQHWRPGATVSRGYCRHTAWAARPPWSPGRRCLPRRWSSGPASSGTTTRGYRHPWWRRAPSTAAWRTPARRRPARGRTWRRGRAARRTWGRCRGTEWRWPGWSRRDFPGNMKLFTYNCQLFYSLINH